MSVHNDPQECLGSIEFRDDWDAISFGAYRYGECKVCGREFREYYSYEQLETTDTVHEDDEPIVVYRR